MAGVVEAEVVEAEVVEAEAVANVQGFPNGWALVSFGCWQVSVSEDALIRLPHSVEPESVGDLVGALLAAQEVALKMRAEAEAREAARTSASRAGVNSRGGLVVTAGPPPAGSVRLPVKAGK
jgi:hypothetical protein